MLRENAVDYFKLIAWCITEKYRGIGHSIVKKTYRKYLDECECLHTGHINIKDIEEELAKKDLYFKD